MKTAWGTTKRSFPIRAAGSDPCFFCFCFLAGCGGPPPSRLGQLFCRLFTCMFDIPKYPWDLSHISPGHLSKFFGLAWIWGHMPLDSFDRVPPMVCWKCEMLRFYVFLAISEGSQGKSPDISRAFFAFCGGGGVNFLRISLEMAGDIPGYFQDIFVNNNWGSILPRMSRTTPGHLCEQLLPSRFWVPKRHFY